MPARRILLRVGLRRSHRAWAAGRLLNAPPVDSGPGVSGGECGPAGARRDVCRAAGEQAELAARETGYCRPGCHGRSRQRRRQEHDRALRPDLRLDSCRHLRVCLCCLPDPGPAPSPRRQQRQLGAPHTVDRPLGRTRSKAAEVNPEANRYSGRCTRRR